MIAARLARRAAIISSIGGGDSGKDNSRSGRGSTRWSGAFGVPLPLSGGVGCRGGFGVDAGILKRHRVSHFRKYAQTNSILTLRLQAPLVARSDGRGNEVAFYFFSYHQKVLGHHNLTCRDGQNMTSLSHGTSPGGMMLNINLLAQVNRTIES